jgi:uncharacterized protein YegP (UPF0339 family)
VSDYRVIVKRSPAKLRQRFHVTIVAANGKTLFTSENLKNLGYARKLAEETAQALDGNLVDLT